LWLIYPNKKTGSIVSRALSKDLQSLGYTSWSLYGTHSFRRGGCQHRIKDNGWSVDMVAGWGGWSQVEAQTMFRYFTHPTTTMSSWQTMTATEGSDSVFTSFTTLPFWYSSLFPRAGELCYGYFFTSTFCQNENNLTTLRARHIEVV
jgi:hypothetical protein